MDKEKIKEKVLERWINYLETINTDVDRKLAKKIHHEDIGIITNLTIEECFKNPPKEVVVHKGLIEKIEETFGGQSYLIEALENIEKSMDRLTEQLKKND